MISTLQNPTDIGNLPVKEGRLIKSLSESTIRDVVDSVVELVTNCDDSYLRLENEGIDTTGFIKVRVKRVGGVCVNLTVSDSAAGMSASSLKKNIEFSGDTSGLKEGRSVRGFMGRGLKESIIALGIGTIYTLKDGILSSVKIYYDDSLRNARYEMYDPIAKINISKEELEEIGFNGESGTVVSIEVNNASKNRIPGRNTLPGRITSHYALRDIMSSEKRKAVIQMIEVDSRENKIEVEEPLIYTYPDGNLVTEQTIILQGRFEAYLKIYESPIQLESPKVFGKAGILIKSENSILDNQLFGYENNADGLYFFGEVYCPYIADLIRSGDESIVDLNRGGLSWRHEVNIELEKTLKNMLGILIEKRESISKQNSEVKVSTSIEKLLAKVCSKLGVLAKDELENDEEPKPGEIDSLIIRPIITNILPNKPRSLSIYIPKYLADEEGTKMVSIKSSNTSIEVLQSQITLDFSKKYQDLLKGSIKVTGQIEGEMSTITVCLGGLRAECMVRVGEEGKGKKGKNLTSANGNGIFRTIKPSYQESPIQRVSLEQETGTVLIYTKFPGIAEYLKDDLSGVNEEKGKILLSELLIEVFCRYIASKHVGQRYEEEFGPIMSDMDKLRKKCTLTIYDTIMNTDISKLLN